MIHKCTNCKKKFETEANYNDHVCSDGLTPKDAGHQGPGFAKIQEAALKRGEERKGKTE